MVGCPLRQCIRSAKASDIYLPNEGKNPFLPIIVSIHGGAFMFSNKADETTKTNAGRVEARYAVVSVVIRMGETKRHCFLKNVDDVKAAIRWIKANSKKYGFRSKQDRLVGRFSGRKFVPGSRRVLQVQCGKHWKT